jgi:hypothetical protein
MSSDPLDRFLITESRPTLDYAPAASEGTRRWWHGSALDWLGSIAIVLLGLALLGTAFVGLALLFGR